MSVVTSEGDVVAGRYRMVGRLGRGGMAEVWQAHDDVLRRQVALKLFHVTGDADDARRAAAEMHTLAGLSHPNLVTVYDAGTDGERTFLVLELVGGPTLADRIDAPGGVNDAELAAIGAELAAALAYIHQRGIVHRDVKPANVLLPASDYPDAPLVKLADFGIAQSAGQERLTQTGMTIGTAKYLAPEQITGQPVGPPADVYALGLVLLEASGHAPEWIGTPVEIAMARLTTAPVVPEELGPVWVPLLTAMTARDPADRPTAAEVQETIGSAAAHPALSARAQHDDVQGRRTVASTALSTGVTPGPPVRSRGHRGGLVWAGAGVIAASAIVTGIVLATGSPDPVAPTRSATTAPEVAGSLGATTPGAAAPTPAVTTPPVSAPSVTPVAQTSAVTPTPSSPAATAATTTPLDPGETKSPKRTPPGQTKTKDKPKNEG